MKRIIFIILIIGFVSCGKEEINPTGCNIKFRGTTFTTTDVYCYNNDIYDSEGENFTLSIYRENRYLKFNYLNEDYFSDTFRMKVDGKIITFDATIKSPVSSNPENINGMCSCSF